MQTRNFVHRNVTCADAGFSWLILMRQISNVVFTPESKLLNNKSDSEGTMGSHFSHEVTASHNRYLVAHD